MIYILKIMSLCKECIVEESREVGSHAKRLFQLFMDTVELEKSRWVFFLSLINWV